VEVIKRGRSLHCPLFTVKYSQNSLNTHRLAIIVAKKEEKTAVGRNKIKRRLRESFRKALNKQTKCADIAVFGKKTCKTALLRDILEEAERLVTLF
jgi:ribonuclease P protein component